MEFDEPPIALDDPSRVGAEPHIDRGDEVGGRSDAPAVGASNEVAGQNARLRRRRVGRHARHRDVGHGDGLRQHKDAGEQNDGENGVHRGARRENRQPLPCGFGGETIGRRRVLLAQHPHESADGQEVDRVERAASREPEDARGQADPELQDAHFGEFGDREVPQLVHRHEESQHGDEQENRDDHARAPETFMPPLLQEVIIAAWILPEMTAERW